MVCAWGIAFCLVEGGAAVGDGISEPDVHHAKRREPGQEGRGCMVSHMVEALSSGKRGTKGGSWPAGVAVKVGGHRRLVIGG